MALEGGESNEDKKPDAHLGAADDYFESMQKLQNDLTSPNPYLPQNGARVRWFCDALLALARAAKAGDVERFTGAPYLAPLSRLDETLAARKPKLTWRPEHDATLAAE